jgi:hypothetical protein
MKAIASMYHLMMKFPMEEGVGEVKGDQTMARKYYNTSLKKASNLTPLVVNTVGNQGSKKAKGVLVEPLDDVTIGEG